MSYKVTFTVTAVKERKRIDAVVRSRIDQALSNLRLEPRPSGVKKLSGTQSDWRIRVGDYRILFEIDDELQLITIWRIAHRRDAYR